MSKYVLFVDQREFATIQAALSELNVILDENYGNYPDDIEDSGQLLDRKGLDALQERLFKGELHLLQHVQAGGVTTYAADNGNALAEKIVELARDDSDADDPQTEDLFSNEPARAYQAAEEYFSDHETDSYEIISWEEVILL